MDRCVGTAALRALLLLLTLPALVGCGDRGTPEVTLLQARPTCGVLVGEAMRVELYGTGSGGDYLSEPNAFNAPLEAHWDLGDGTVVRDRTRVVHDYTEAGTYTVTLRVSDDDGDSSERSIQITVLSPEEALQVQATVDRVEEVWERPEEDEEADPVLVGYRVRCSGGYTTGCQETALYSQYKWEWDFGDGTAPAATAWRGVHVYETPPEATIFTLRLTVTELASGVSRSVEMPVTLPPGS